MNAGQGDHAAGSAAATGPVALVAVDVNLPHLDRPFEYLVPPELSAAAIPGVRVKVRFAGREVSGFILERRKRAEHQGRLTPIRRIVGTEAVFTPALQHLTRTIADRYAGSLADVVRLAIPPRHAAAEKALTRAAEPDPPVADPDPTESDTPEPDPGPWALYPAGAAFLRRVADGQDPAASWLALPRAGDPGQDWPEAFAVAAGAALRGGRGFLLVAPDRRDVDRLHDRLSARVGTGRFVRLTADQGAHARYTAWLKVLRGHVAGAIGTRSAAFAPVQRLGLVAWWDDGDDLYAEPRAPYPHTRDVLAAQAQAAGAALLSGGYVRSVQIADWVASGRMRPLEADRAQVRALAPRVSLATDGPAGARDGPAARAHLPPAAWRAAHAALADGPVLVQVPRRGYVPALTCQECRTPARCPSCAGPLALGAAGAAPSCRWCGWCPTGEPSEPRGPGLTCAQCGSTRWRSAVVGHRRTAEELGRAFPSVPVVTSGGAAGVRACVEDRPALVIATPGAEPVAPSGYAAVLLLDAWAFLDRPTLDAGQEALRRWTAAAALVRPGTTGAVARQAAVARPTPTGPAPGPAPVVLCGAPDDVPVPAVEALVRWAPGWFAERELAERHALRLPPAAWMAQLTGPQSRLVDLAAEVSWPPGAVLGDVTPTGQDGTYQMLVRVPMAQAALVNAVLNAVRAHGSARKDVTTPAVRVGVSDG